LQLTSAAISWVATVNCIVAVAVPEFEPATVNVVLPHPSVVGALSPPSTNEGSTILMVSPILMCVFKVKSYVTAVGAVVTGFDRVRTSLFSALVSQVPLVMAEAPMSSELASVNAMVALAAGFAIGLVVTPLDTVMLHTFPALSFVVPVVSVRVAVSVPALVIVAAKVDGVPLSDGSPPQLVVVGLISVAFNPNLGSTIVMVSPTSRSWPKMNPNARVDCELVVEGVSLKTLLTRDVEDAAAVTMKSVKCVLWHSTTLLPAAAIVVIPYDENVLVVVFQ
jgi:hypothetical protein